MGNRIIIALVAVTLLLLGFYLINSQKPKIQTDHSSASPTTSPSVMQSRSVNTKPSKDCFGKPTPTLTEGPYYKPGSPEKINLREEVIHGKVLYLNGYVFGTDCKPVAGAWIDFWQADGEGNYDNHGYKLRGHQLTDKEGKYSLATVIPGEYPGRTPHIHLKLRAPGNNQEITTQVFLPGIELNESDSIFNDLLVMEVVHDTQNEMRARFNFVIDH